MRRQVWKLLPVVALGAALLVVGLAIRGTGSGGAKLVGHKLAGEAGIFEINHSYRANVGDLSGNGADDLIFIPHWADFPRVYINRDDGTFVDIVPTHFPVQRVNPRDRHDCPIGDVTGNGRADIFCTTGGSKGGVGATPSELWLQQEDGTFEHWRDTDQFNLGPAKDAYGRGRDALFLDANNNGRLDLYIQNAYPRKDGRSSNSRLFINEEGKRYARARKHGFAGANIPVGGSVLQAIDYNGNGFTDILACGKDGIYLFRNQRGRDFREVGERRRGRRSCVWAQLAHVDRSGRPALVRLNRQALTVHKQRPNGSFGPAVYKRPLRHGASFATGDVNGNGLDDIFVIRQGPTSSDGSPAPRGNPADDRPDAMLINRGNGTDFERIATPQTKRGRGDTVTAIDHDGDGRAAFVVMNGHRKARGPVQLIAFERP